MDENIKKLDELVKLQKLQINYLHKLLKEVEDIGFEQRQRKLIPDELTYDEGRCVFLLEGNACRIHAVKPKTASEFKCWTPEEDHTKEVLKTWNDNQLFKRFGIRVV